MSGERATLDVLDFSDPKLPVRRRLVDIDDIGEQRERSDAPDGGAADSNGGDRAVSDDERLDRLASLPPLEYDRVREAEAQELGARVATLDAQVKRRRPRADCATNSSGNEILFDEIEPWPELVDGAALLDAIAEKLLHHLALPLHAAEAVTLWLAVAHLHDAIDTSPILAFVSPEMRCGKTRALGVVRRLVPRPLPASSITAAALFRAVERFRPTLLIDEADTFLRSRDELRGILNSGHTRGSAFVIRTVGDDHEPRRFTTWGAKAIAQIGTLAPTLEDRAIRIQMRRRTAGERIAPLRGDRDHGFEELRSQLARWAADQREAMAAADPTLPGELSDRAADNWRPLVAAADLAGGAWPTHAREAAVALSAHGAGDESLGAMLLSDIRRILTEMGSERIGSEQLVGALVALVDRPWGEIGRGGKPLTPNALARRLRPFGIAPEQMRIEGGGRKGYTAEAFADAFARYLPPIPTETAKQPRGVGELDDFATET